MWRYVDSLTFHLDPLGGSISQHSSAIFGIGFHLGLLAWELFEEPISSPVIQASILHHCLKVGSQTIQVRR